MNDEDDRIEEVHPSTGNDRPRHRVVLAMLGLAAALLVAFTVYGMVSGDPHILGPVLTLARDIVIAVLGWAIGRYGSL